MWTALEPFTLTYLQFMLEIDIIKNGHLNLPK